MTLDQSESLCFPSSAYNTGSSGQGLLSALGCYNHKASLLRCVLVGTKDGLYNLG